MKNEAAKMRWAERGAQRSAPLFGVIEPKKMGAHSERARIAAKTHQ
jgi:hypothetical protein